MADKAKITLSRAYTYSGKTYGPGEVEVPAGAVESLTKKEAKAADRVTQNYEPPAPVTPSLTKGELHDPRKRPTQVVSTLDTPSAGNLVQNSVRSVRSDSQPPDEDATAEKSHGRGKK